MSLKSSIGHTLNGIAEIVNNSWARKYAINNGVDHGLSVTYYSERLVEIPFVFKHIKSIPCTVLDIGCGESIVSVQLAMMGYRVIGIDIREYGYSHHGFKFIKDDFLKYKFTEKFDVAIDISAIEHFGLDAYGYNKENSRADKQAVDKVLDILKPGGQFIFTAPFGVHEVIKDFERIYDISDLHKLFGDFKIKDMEFYKIYKHKVLSRITQKEATGIRYNNNLYAVVLVNAFRI